MDPDSGNGDCSAMAISPEFSPYAENMICFIDEPTLSAFGSSTYVSV